MYLTTYYEIHPFVVSFSIVWIKPFINGAEFSRKPSQIACMQTALQVNENSCMVLILVCKNNLNLSMCSSFFFGYVLGCLLLSFIVLSSLLPRCAALIFCFNISRFCSPAINQISLRQSKGWFPFILICRWEKHCLLGLCINYADICISWQITSM